MQAVILAGGKGRRLQPYTAEIPKPLVTIGDRPVIEILLHGLQRSGVTKVHIAVNHLAHLIMATLGDGSRWDIDISYSHEPKPLSTIGPLTLIDNLPDHFLVVNGDILTDLDFKKLFDFHLANQTVATIATCERTVTNDFGTLETDPAGLVTGFQEKPMVNFTVSTGIYVFSRSVLEYIPMGEKFGFDDMMFTLLEQRQPVATYPFNGFWLDIGRPDDYELANRDLDTINRLLK